MTLLGGRLEPITSEFGFIRAPLGIVAAWLAEREAEWTRERGVTIRSKPVSGGLEAALRHLLPLTSVERRRMLAMPTTSPWTAVFENGWQGGDAARLSLAARELSCQAVRVVAVEDAAVGGRHTRYGARMFELYGANQTDFLNYIRAISAANDGGRWRFDQAGTPLPGEDARWFAAKQVKQRFKEEHLEALLRTLDIEAFDEHFYGEQGVIIERHGPTAAGLREYDLAEVQAQWRSLVPPGTRRG